MNRSVLVTVLAAFVFAGCGHAVPPEEVRGFVDETGQRHVLAHIGAEAGTPVRGTRLFNCNVSGFTPEVSYTFPDSTIPAEQLRERLLEQWQSDPLIRADVEDSAVHSFAVQGEHFTIHAAVTFDDPPVLAVNVHGPCDYGLSEIGEETEWPE